MGSINIESFRDNVREMEFERSEEHIAFLRGLIAATRYFIKEEKTEVAMNKLLDDQILYMEGHKKNETPDWLLPYGVDADGNSSMETGKDVVSYHIPSYKMPRLL